MTTFRLPTRITITKQHHISSPHTSQRYIYLAMSKSRVAQVYDCFVKKENMAKSTERMARASSWLNSARSEKEPEEPAGF